MNTNEQLLIQDSHSAIRYAITAPIHRLELLEGGEQIFRVTEEGDVLCRDTCINEDDAALANCFRAWVKRVTGLTVRRGAPRKRRNEKC